MGSVVQRRGEGGVRRRRRRARNHAMAEINITPMVDVMLVLLIIFMVAAPLLTVGVPVKLPDTAAQALPTPDEEPLTISLAADGRVVLQKTEVPFDQLVAKLKAVAAERKDKRVYLRADGSVPYAQVAQVMGALNKGGFHDIGLVTDPNGPTLDGSGLGAAAPGGAASTGAAPAPAGQ